MNGLINLQQRADALAIRLTGDDRLLVWELRSEMMKRERALQAIQRTITNNMDFADRPEVDFGATKS